jgi:hypothetical protein
MGLASNHQVIQALAADGADHPLHERVLHLGVGEVLVGRRARVDRGDHSSGLVMKLDHYPIIRLPTIALLS